MRLKLLIDECLLDKLLVEKLREAKHDVLTVTEAALTGKSDHAILEAAIAQERLVITLNCSDFLQLHFQKLAKKGAHPGILLVYRQNLPGKEMSNDDIIKAIANLESTQTSLANEVHPLNTYKY